MENTGPDTEIEAAEAAVAPAAIAERIVRYRMADLSVVVRDEHGRPLPEAAVSITQTRHAFLFGCNIFGLQPGDTSADQKQYQERFVELLNYATLPFYWGSFEPRAGEPQYDRLGAMADWCNEHGLVCKGHPLIWHDVYPKWAAEDADGARAQLRARVMEIVSRFRGKIGIWDVVNEALAAVGHAKPNGETRWIESNGPANAVAEALSWARSAGAQETFLYNDFDITDNNIALLQELADKNALPDVIGIQSHMHEGPWPMSKVWTVCRRAARFGLPIHFTEATVISGPRRQIDWATQPTKTDWLTTPEEEEQQADYVARFYTLLFSDPAVRGITWWDFSDANAWLGAPAGFLRRDMSPKPAYERLLALIHKVWWTDANLRTDAGGRCNAHVFYGDYKITASDPSGRTVTQAVTLPEAGGARSVEVIVSGS